MCSTRSLQHHSTLQARKVLTLLAHKGCAKLHDKPVLAGCCCAGTGDGRREPPTRLACEAGSQGCIPVAGSPQSASSPPGQYTTPMVMLPPCKTHVPAVRLQAALSHTRCKLADHPDYWAWIIAWVEPDAVGAKGVCQEDSEYKQTDATHAPMPKPACTRLRLRLYTEVVVCSKQEVRSERAVDTAISHCGTVSSLS